MYVFAFAIGFSTTIAEPSLLAVAMIAGAGCHPGDVNNIEELGRPVRINGSMVPPMKIRDFTFSSLSDAV